MLAFLLVPLAGIFLSGCDSKTKPAPKPPDNDPKEFIKSQLNTGQLDGAAGLSPKESMAFERVWEDFESVEVDVFVKEKPLQKAMADKLQINFKRLENINPKQQVVYLEFYQLKEFYKEHFQSTTQQDFSTWKKQVLKYFGGKFVLNSGEFLNIKFLTERPKEGQYTTVTITPQDLKDYLNSHPETKIQAVQSFIHDEAYGDLYQKSRKILDRVNQELEGPIADGVRWAMVGDDPEFQQLVDERTKKALGTTLRFEHEEFGNPNPNEFIWVHAVPFHLLLTKSKKNLVGDSKEGGTFVPWLATDPENLARAFAEIAAHEIGHALGLNHPGMTLVAAGYDYRYYGRTPHTMDTPQVKQFAPFARFRFNQFAEDYFKMILGVE